MNITISNLDAASKACDNTILKLKEANKRLDKALASARQPVSTDSLDREKAFWKTMRRFPCKYHSVSTRMSGLIGNK